MRDLSVSIRAVTILYLNTPINYALLRKLFKKSFLIISNLKILWYFNFIL
jgi:hypothetical protein